ncbi:unnamed protein product [Phaeothamnion confervicola]
MRYCSTRGGSSNCCFEDVVLGGLANDGGLFVPQNVPVLPPDVIESWRALSFPELAHRIMSRFISEDEISSVELADLTARSATAFATKDVTPVVKVGDAWVLELFHGPTFAFKDVALQFLGNLFEFFLQRRRRTGWDATAHLTILGATSGDTGSAAIYGLRGKQFVDCFIMFPTGRVSEIQQERQMTTVADDNIHCISIDGTFDDCQALVKAAFADEKFREEVQLGAVNSINWARVLAQMTYYFWAYFRVTDDAAAAANSNGSSKPLLSFSVPTGNFGDILAGYYARRMGLPVAQLLVATNENDILHRFFSTGRYWREGVQPTLAPSMDICVSSNFERYLFHLAKDNADVLRHVILFCCSGGIRRVGWMQGFERTGKLTVEGDLLAEAQGCFCSARITTEENLATIRRNWVDHGYLFCPHSSIGAAAPAHAKLDPATTVVLATAHPAKFPGAVSKVVDPLPAAPEALARLHTLPVSKSVLPNDLAAVQAFIRDAAAADALGVGGAAASKVCDYWVYVVCPRSFSLRRVFPFFKP